MTLSLRPSTINRTPTAVFQTADGREIQLHSRFDPWEEAHFLVRELTPQERTLYVVLGFGLGYHVKALLDRIPASSHVVIVEPGTTPLSASAAEIKGHPAAQWMREPRVHFHAHHDPKLAALHLADRMASLRMLAVKLFTHVPSMMTDENFYRAVSTEIPLTFPEHMQRQLNALDRTIESDLGNFWANLSRTWRATSIGALRGKWSGRPLIIVSSGPSLTEALPQLAAASQNALVLATGSSVKLLLERNLRPDLVISVDPYEYNAAHFEGWDTRDVPLVHYHRIHRDVLRSYAGPTFSFVMHDEPALPFAADAERSPFQRGGTVAFSALQLAHHLGASPIIFVGQDFAFAGGRTHAQGALYNETFDDAALPADYVMAPGVDGGQVVTSRLHQAYLLHMQDYLLRVSKRSPTVRHINVSRAGAIVRGMEYLSLTDALGAGSREVLGASSTEARSAAAMLRSALSPPRSGGLQSRQRTVRQWAVEARALASDLDNVERFEVMFARFKATMAYVQLAGSYDAVHYVYETKYQGGKSTGAIEFGQRFKRHLQSIAEELDQMSEAE